MSGEDLCQHIPGFEQNEILSTVLPMRDGLISSCISLSALPVCGTPSLPLSALPDGGSLITSCLCQHCLCVVLHHFLCQHCLCVVLLSLPFFVSTACVVLPSLPAFVSTTCVVLPSLPAFLCQHYLCVVLSSVSSTTLPAAY